MEVPRAGGGRLACTPAALKEGGNMNANELVAKLRDLGIHQEGDTILRQECEPFYLPAERSDALTLWDQLRGYVDRLQEIYPFSKGVGLAAPQIGVSRAMSIVRPPNGAHEIALINPVTVWQSEDQDEKYEGCLSFFDIRVPVPRPHAIRIQLSTLDGQPVEHAYDRGLARLVLHEVDHLRGTLARDLIHPDARLLPLAEYRGASHEWRY
jgi:peptide deformylase